VVYAVDSTNNLKTIQKNGWSLETPRRTRGRSGSYRVSSNLIKAMILARRALGRRQDAQTQSETAEACALLLLGVKRNATGLVRNPESRATRLEMLDSWCPLRRSGGCETRCRGGAGPDSGFALMSAAQIRKS
jgi:hypothetical protein